MARDTPIRITKNDKKEYARLVRNARAKINRLEKKFGLDDLIKSGINLREEMPLPKLEEFETRKELNEWKETQKNFVNRFNADYQLKKNKYGIVASKKWLTKMENLNKREQRIARDEINRYKDTMFKSKGEDVETIERRKEHMQDGAVMGIRVPSDFDFEEVRHKGRMKTVEENMSRRSSREYYDQRQIQLKENFITALEGSFHGEEEDLVALIRQVPPDDFYELWLGEADFEFSIYDSKGSDVHANENHINRITGYIERYLEGKTISDNKENMDLKGF